MEKDVVGADLIREYMPKLCSTKDLFVREEREILVWHHRLNRCSFKYLLILSNRGVITRKISWIRKLPPCVSLLFGKYNKRPWTIKGKHLGQSGNPQIPDLGP